MDILAEKENAELAFWREWTQKPDYLAIRQQDFLDKTRWFHGYLDKETGLGLDLACGPDSVFEHSPSPVDVIAVDRLLDLYSTQLRNRIRYTAEDAEAMTFPTASFDWIFCINMIDHTPNPERVVDEIRRVLVPGGRLYFEVHFDPGLYLPHYTVWDEAKVKHYFRQGFELIRSVKEWKVEWSKYVYWAIFKKA